jgi:hypothetical protein
VPELTVEPAVTCIYCQTPGAEPEQDGDFIYYACAECGGEFGYRRAVQEVPLCAAGLEIRVDAAQPPGVLSLESGGQRASVFLGNVIKRRPECVANPPSSC